MHEKPAWRARANFILHIKVEGDRLEQLWSSRINDNRFEICCIPFFAYDLALGDIVETAPELGKQYMVQRVVVPSSHYTFRVWYKPDDHPSHMLVTERAAELGCPWEWFSGRLMSLDAPDHETAQQLANHLGRLQSEGRLHYETGQMHDRPSAEPAKLG